MPAERITRRFSEKLQDLNRTQPSIQSLSNWCLSHRNHAKEIVETWNNEFQSIDEEKKVSFLYLVNDVVQKCRRKKYSEFVGEFWCVLPPLMRDIHQNGDDETKNIALRLVDIWQERKTFVSLCDNIRDVMFAKSRSYDELIFPKTLKRKSSGQIALGDDGGATIGNKYKTKAFTVQELELKRTETDDGNWMSMEEKEFGEETQSLRDCIAQLKASGDTNKDLVSFLKETVMKESAHAERENANKMLKLLEGSKSTTGRDANVSEVVRPQTPSLFTSPSTPFVSGEIMKDDSKSAAAKVAAKLMNTAGKEDIFKSILSSLAAENSVSNPANQIASPIPPNQVSMAAPGDYQLQFLPNPNPNIVENQVSMAALGDYQLQFLSNPNPKIVENQVSMAAPGDYQLQFLPNPNPYPNPNRNIVENLEPSPSFTTPFSALGYPSMNLQSNMIPPLPPGPLPRKLPFLPGSGLVRHPN